MWFAAVQSVRNAFRPMPPSLSSSTHRHPAPSSAPLQIYFSSVESSFSSTPRFSGWPTVGTCGRTATSLQVVNLLKEWMADKGILVQLTTDGSPQINLAGVQAVLRRLGNQPHGQQSPPPPSQRRCRGCSQSSQDPSVQNDGEWQHQHRCIPRRPLGVPKHASRQRFQPFPTAVRPAPSIAGAGTS